MKESGIFSFLLWSVVRAFAYEYVAFTVFFAEAFVEFFKTTRTLHACTFAFVANQYDLWVFTSPFDRNLERKTLVEPVFSPVIFAIHFAVKACVLCLFKYSRMRASPPPVTP